MTDQSIEGFFLAGLEFGNHLRISSQNCVNSGLNGTGVRNLLQAECFDKGVDIVAFLFPNRREDRTSALLVERAVAHAIKDLTDLFGRDRAFFNGELGGVELS